MGTDQEAAEGGPTSIRSDAVLIAAAAAGDGEAFVSLVRRHDPSMRGLAVAIVGTEDADDVLQDAYLRAFRSIPRFGGRSSFNTWLYRIVHNAAVDHVRSTSRVRPMTGNAAFDAPIAGAQHHVETRLDIDRALACLPLSQRAVVILVDSEGLDYAAAGGVLGIPAGTVASRLSEARRTLRRLLKEVG